MAGEIKHSWHGTVLTITSDAGTSSADLQGQRGIEGIRGPQGPAGLIINPDGTVDYNGYATEEYVDYKIEQLEQEEPDLSNYYTKAEIDATLAEFQPSGGGGGGGGSGNNAILSITNVAGWLSKSIPQGSSCYVECSWSSLEGGLSTGGGILTIYVDGIVKYTSNVEQGRFKVNVGPYLPVGKSSVRVSVTDVYGNTKSIIYTVNVVTLTITSTFDATVAYTGDILFSYTPFGNVEKDVHFILDDTEIHSEEVYTSGRQRDFIIPAQEHGSHTFEVYFDTVIDGQLIPSNVLYYDLICYEEGETAPIIASAFDKNSMVQFETINIYYSVYSPAALTANIVLAINGKAIKELTVDRTQQLWDFRAETPGENTLTITCGDTVKTFKINVEESEIDCEAETNGLELYLSSYGRSNNEALRNSWIYDNIACQFTNYNWTSDGWVTDAEEMVVHRVSGDARLFIPLNLFGTDFRDNGKTIEIEFATRDIMDYDAVIASCMNGGIGFEMTAQKATLKSEQSEIFTQYKENEHIRLTFVIEKRKENRLIYTYLNGIMCGVIQYPDNDNFAQAEPVGISIGSNLATIDIYTIRVYKNNLTRYQILDNWIADTQDIEERLKRYRRNNVYDAYGSIIINNLPAELPYLILEAPGLPQYKDNKLPVDGRYTDPLNVSKCFNFDNAIADVQGTSSAGYARKNYIIEFPNEYKLREDSIPTDTFTFKADVASSEGANNVELVRLYNAICPYKTPPQLENSSVRQGIDGFPIVIFHNDGKETTFIGKYNFNNDKKTPEVFGFEGEDESWEIKNNTSNRVLWKSADFSGTDWLNDFEGRYPKDNTNPEKLARFASWVSSTDVSQASNAALGRSVTYDGITYTNDTPKYRLAKFKAEIEDYAVLDSALFYYLFTELFLMVDSRAKNAFPTIFEGEDKVVWLPYDMDTALGINNEGALTFGYELEDIDKTETGADVYNGQQSVFWINLRDAFGDKLKEMYQKLRSDNVLSYEIVEKMFEDHQKVWPEAIWNEDAWYKYLQPLVEDNTAAYLTMLQGSKEEQRKWWLYNRFRYIDAKYNAGDAEKDFITLRGYSKSDITVEPYADIYATIKYGSYLVQERALRGDSYTLECPLDTLNDTEIYVYSASQLRSLGDLSGLKVGYADFSMGTKLQELKVGSAANGYSNNNLTELYLGNNTLLKSLDVRNCPNLAQSVDLSGCANIEHVYFDGTAIKGCSLPNGGILKTLHLPGTITNLTIINQPALNDLTIPTYENVTTLRLENAGDKVDVFTILNQLKPNSRVRLINMDWTFRNAAEVETFYDLLDTMKGLDENNNNMDKVQISGRIHIPMLTGDELESLRSRYTHITITYDSAAFEVTYVNYDNSVLYETLVAANTKAIDPVMEGLIPIPTKEPDEGAAYVFTSWDSLPIITGNTTITAQYRTIPRYYTVNFYNGETLLETRQVAYGEMPLYTGARPVAEAGATKTQFAGWHPVQYKVDKDQDYHALFAKHVGTGSTESVKITDSWEQIIASIQDGSYVDKYRCADFVDTSILINGTTKTMRMRLVAFAADTKEDGTLAPMSWVCQTNIPGDMPWHDTNDVLGWEDCSLRHYLNNTVINLLPIELQNSIVSVYKTQLAHNSLTNSTDTYWQTTVDKIWIPSKREVVDDSVYVDDVCVCNHYDVVMFASQEPWLRDKYGPEISYNGSHSSTNAGAVAFYDSTSYGSTAWSSDATTARMVQIGFCIG